MRSISRKIIISSSLSLITLCCSAVVFAQDSERIITLQENVAQTKLIKLKVPMGEVLVSGVTGDTVTASIKAKCTTPDEGLCHQLLKELAWTKKTGKTLKLGVKQMTNHEDVIIQVKLSVPNDKKLDLSLRIGELGIDGTSACLSADVNVGTIKITLQESQLASAKLSAQIGEVKLATATGSTIEGHQSLLVGSKLKWNQGTGTCHTKASALVGEVELRLN